MSTSTQGEFESTMAAPRWDAMLSRQRRRHGLRPLTIMSMGWVVRLDVSQGIVAGFACAYGLAYRT